jgi:probable HAF family extracellular repeat protein
MRAVKLTRILTFSILLLANGFVNAQGPGRQDTAKHHKYKFVDLGTFGGPDSIIPFVQRVLTSDGTVVGIAETDIPDPFAPNCASPNCQVQNGFQWRNGKLINLHGLYDGGASTAQAINDLGIIVGDAQTGLVDQASGFPQTNAVRWKHGKIESLGTLGGSSSSALSISSQGQISGWSETGIVDPLSGQTETHAFLFRNGVMHDLASLGGTVSFGQDVNDRSEVVGFSSNATNETHPVLWSNGQITDLSLGGTAGGSGFINNLGQAVGDSTLPGDAEDHAFFWSGRELYDLGTLGGTLSLPTGLSVAGDVSGVSTTTNDELLHAVLWRNRHIKDLGTVSGDACSWAWGLNIKDQVVGISLPAPCDFSVAHAFLWEGGSMVDLNTLIPPNSGLQLVYAEAINDAGEIVGIGVPPGVSPADVEVLGHAYVLIPEDDLCDSQCDPADGTSLNSVAATSGNPKAANIGLMRRILDRHRARNRRLKR